METNAPLAVTAEVIMNRETGPGQCLLALKVPALFPEPEPGQFVMIKVSSGNDPLLRRPFSVHDFYCTSDSGVLTILFQVAGRGTGLLSRLYPQAKLNILGPLGCGFAMPPRGKRMIVIAGGMGVAPLSYLAARYLSLTGPAEEPEGGEGPPVVFYLGARTASCLWGVNMIESRRQALKISTDDGSLGYHGTVIELFKGDLASLSEEKDQIYACGPAAMLRELAGLLSGTGIICQVSMEERMACGLGACLGCAVPIRGKNGEIFYKRACKDGPVFKLNEVGWIG